MDLLLLLQAILYFCISILGFFVCIPVGVNRSNFDGHCILYADVYGSYFRETSPSNCDFPIYFGVFGMIIFGLAAGLCFMFFTLKSRGDKNAGTGVWTLVFLPLNAVLALITLIVACMLSVGIKVFCDRFEEKLYSCEVLENQPLKRSSSNTGNFLTLSSLSQAGAWIGFLFYLVHIGIGVVRFRRNRRHKQENSTG